jgi:hypothetical protein
MHIHLLATGGPCLQHSMAAGAPNEPHLSHRCSAAALLAGGFSHEWPHMVGGPGRALGPLHRCLHPPIHLSCRPDNVPRKELCAAHALCLAECPAMRHIPVLRLQAWVGSLQAPQQMDGEHAPAATTGMGRTVHRTCNSFTMQCVGRAAQDTHARASSRTSTLMPLRLTEPGTSSTPPLCL